MTSEEKYQSAQAWAWEGNPDIDLGKAIELLKEVMQSQPAHDLARNLLADCYRRKGDHELRLAVWIDGYDNRPDTRKKIQIAICLYDMGRYEDGLKWVEDENLDPRVFSHSGLYIRSRLYFALGQPEKGEDDTMCLMEFEASLPSVWDEED